MPRKIRADIQASAADAHDPNDDSIIENKPEFADVSSLPAPAQEQAPAQAQVQDALEVSMEPAIVKKPLSEAKKQALAKLHQKQRERIAAARKLEAEQDLAASEPVPVPVLAKKQLVRRNAMILNEPAQSPPVHLNAETKPVKPAKPRVKPAKPTMPSYEEEIINQLKLNIM